MHFQIFVKLQYSTVNTQFEIGRLYLLKLIKKIYIYIYIFCTYIEKPFDSFETKSEIILEKMKSKPKIIYFYTFQDSTLHKRNISYLKKYPTNIVSFSFDRVL